MPTARRSRQEAYYHLHHPYMANSANRSPAGQRLLAEPFSFETADFLRLLS